jgi:ABC-type branched-subunit amino acid transport system ATPase component
VTRWSRTAARAPGSRATFQHSRSFRALPCAENVEVAALGVGARPRRGRGAPSELLELLGLERLAERRPDARARRRAAARRRARARDRARASCCSTSRPRAARGGGARVRRGRPLVRDDHDAGVLLIDHNMALVMDVCDRIHVLDQGRRSPRDAGRDPRNLDVAAAYLGESAVRSEPVTELALELDGSRSATAPSPAVRGLSLASAGRDRRPDRPERRGQVDDAARDHGLVPAPRATSACAARRCAAPPGGDRARGVALVPEGRRIFAELTVEENLRLGLAGRRGAARDAARASTSSSRSCASSAPRRRRALGRPAAAARDRAARSSRGPTCSCSTSRRSGLAPTSSTSSSRRCRDPRARRHVLLVEQRAQRTVALADRTHVLANGELRLTLDPGDADDTDDRRRLPR